MLKIISHLVIATLVFSFSIHALAASVTQVKGTRVLLNLEGDSIAAGAKVFLLNANGKRVAIVNVTSVKGDRAVGTVTKGKAQAGFTVQTAAGGSSAPSSSAAAAKNSSDDSSSEEAPTRSTVVRSGSRSGSGNSKLSGGVLVGFGMQSMSLTAQYDPDGGGVQPNRSESASLKGSAISIKVFGDYDLSDSFTIRLAVGLEPFKATGSTTQLICNNGSTQNCEVVFNYIGFEGGLQYNLMKGSTRAWVGLGYSFLMEMSKSINIPNLQPNGKTNQLLLIGAGADIGVGRNGSYIPLVIEYGMFPGSSNVTASGIFLRSGYAFSF